MTAKQIRALVEAARRGDPLPLLNADDARQFRLQARRAGLRVETEPTHRTPKDCLRRAVTSAYGIAYEDTPEQIEFANGDAQAAVWDEWAAARGLRWWRSTTHAPVGWDCWIAVVPAGPNREGHALVMSRERLVHDVNEGMIDAKWLWRSVQPSDLIAAVALLPDESPLWDVPIPQWVIGRAAA